MSQDRVEEPGREVFPGSAHCQASADANFLPFSSPKTSRSLEAVVWRKRLCSFSETLVLDLLRILGRARPGGGSVLS